jgi:hypothetical protein
MARSRRVHHKSRLPFPRGFACGFSVLALFLGFSRTAASTAAQTDDPAATVILVGSRNLQEVIQSAPSHSVLMCNRNLPVTLSTPITIDKPLTLRGLNARLPERLGNTSLIIVLAPGVSITDFELHGNASSVSQNDRAPLLRIGAGDFAVERGLFTDSSKDGIMIEAADKDIVGGVVRDIIGVGVIRDTVSISGGTQGAKIRNVLADNVRAYKSSRRGAVEVSDGTDNVTVRKVYAENCVYAVDVQDHNQPRQDNRNVVVQDIYALHCKHALRTSNSPKGHLNLTIRDVTAERCELPLSISNTDNVILENVRVLNHESSGASIAAISCNGLSIHDVTVVNTASKGAALLLKDCNHTTIDGVVLRGGAPNLASAVSFLATAGKPLTGLCIHNVVAPNVRQAGIVLATEREGGPLTDFIISDNLARVANTMNATNGIIHNNLPQTPGTAQPAASPDNP